MACGTPFFGAGAFNLIKFILSIVSIFFDLIFMFQHYVLYRHNRKPLDVPSEDIDTFEEKKGINKSDNLS